MDSRGFKGAKVNNSFLPTFLFIRFLYGMYIYNYTIYGIGCWAWRVLAFQVNVKTAAAPV